MYGLFDSILSLDILAQFDPPATPPPGLGPVMSTILSWTKWIAIFCGIGGIFVIAIMMMIGRRNRSQMAADGMSALPWIVGGFLLIGLSATLAETLVETGKNADVVIDGSTGTTRNPNWDSSFTGELGEAETIDDMTAPV